MQHDPPRILVVDDEPGIRKVVARALADAGFAARTVANRSGAIEALREDRFSLVILDVNLPDANGFALCEEIAREHELPVVMLTVIADESEVVRALESGADDYVRKPFSARELTARVSSVLRRARRDERPGDTLIEAGALQLDPRTYRAQVGDMTLSLTPTEFRLLSLLAQHRGRVLAHDELLRHVWGAEYEGEHHMLHVSISRLRQKLARAGDGVLVRTVPAVGYELVIDSP